jgi:glycosyltransferase involved in cell wall biosynthesis
VRVLFVAPSFAPAWFYGGPTVSNLNLAREVRDLGYDITVLTTNAKGNGSRLTSEEQTAMVAALRIPIRYCDVTFGEDISGEFIAVLIQAVELAEVVYLTGVFSYHPLLTILLCRLIGRGLVWAPRGSLQHIKIARRSMAKDCFVRILRFIAPCKTIMHYTSANERDASIAFVPCFPSVVIANGCSTRPVALRSPAKESQTVRALFLGRISPSKGIDLVLRALALLTASARERITFTVVGEGDPKLLNSLRLLSVNLGLTNLVHWVGPIYDEEAKAELMTTFNLGIFASTGENFGNAIAELLGNGIPVLVGDNLPWVDVEKRGCGIVVPRTIESFAAALTTIISNPEKLREMGDSGVEFSRDLPTWRDAGAQLAQAFEEAK